MHRKNRSRLARTKFGELNTGWYGCGSPFNANMPNTAARHAPSTAHSNVTGINAGQEWNGLPPTLIGYATAETQYSSEYPPIIPSIAPTSTTSDTRLWCAPMASAASSSGYGVYASILR